MVMSARRAVSYARFSSAQQASGSSLERQIKLTREYCETHGLALDETLTDEGLSAYKGDHTARGSLGRFYEAVQAGRVERGTYLIVEHLDRLSRDAVRPALTALLNLIEAGIRIVTLYDGHIYEDASKSVELDLITAILHMSEAHKASATKSKRLAEAWSLKRASGAPLTRMCPAWLSVRNDAQASSPFDINESGAAIVRRIFREAAAGLGSYSIASRLNADRIPPLTGNKVHGAKLPNGKPNPKAGQPLSSGWNKSRIIAIIKSDQPLGWFQPHKKVGKDRVPVGEPVRDYYPAVIDQATADKARSNVASRVFAGAGSGRKGDVISNLFTGVARCTCGATMFLSHRHEPSNRSGWLRCSVAVRDRSRCSITIGVPYARLEQAVIRDFNVIKRIVKAMPIDDKSREIRGRLASRRAEAVRLKDRIDEMASDLNLPYPVLRTQIATMSERHEALVAECADLDKKLLVATPLAVGDLEKNYLTDRLGSAAPAVRRKARAELASMIKSVFGTITTDGERVTLCEVPVNDGADTLRVCYDSDFAEAWVLLNEKPISTVDDFRSSAKSGFTGSKFSVSIIESNAPDA